jgi:hypothetical protein
MQLDALLNIPFVLRPTPKPVPGDLRIAWGVAVLLLMLARSRSNKAKLAKLHLLGHALTSEEARRTTIAVLEKRQSATSLVVRFEPWVMRALGYAHTWGFVSRDGEAAQLTNIGKAIVDQIDHRDDILLQERQFLDSAGRAATETTVEAILRMRTPA